MKQLFPMHALYIFAFIFLLFNVNLSAQHSSSRKILWTKAFQMSMQSTDTTNIAVTTCDSTLVGVDTMVYTNQLGLDSVVITTTTLDTIPPTITCPNDLFVLRDSALCGAVVNYTITATDNCNPVPMISIIEGLASGSVFPLGSTQVTAVVDNGYGLTDTCSFTVMVGSVIPTPADFVLNDDATNIGGSCFQLTQTINDQNGSLWYQNKMTLNNDFCLTFDLNFGTKDVPGADGMAFVLQPINTGQGASGGGIGYQGISPSVVVEFDTYQNGSHFDPFEDHIAIQSNGSVNHATNALVPLVLLPNIEDGLDHAVRLDWDAASTTLRVYFDGVLQTSLSQDIVTTIFGGDAGVYWGWTGSTGALNNNQTVCISSVSFTEEPTIVADTLIASCGGATDGAIDVSISGGLAPYSISWSNGDTTEDLSGLAPGSYTITVTDNCGVIATETYSVDSSGTSPSPVISGLMEYCEGTGGVVLDAGVGYATYSWLPNGLSTQSITALAGSYTVTVTDSSGCSGMSPAFVVTELPIPDAGVDAVDTVCEANVVDLLTLVSAPGGSFVDSDSTGGLLGTDFNTSGLSAGDYTLLYIVPSGNICDDDSAVITLTVEENLNQTCVISSYDPSNPNDHVFVVFDFPKATGGTYLAARFLWDGPDGQFIDNGNGTATITGTVQLKQDPNVKFDVFILLENQMDWSSWSALGRTYAYKPATQALAALEHINWDYYEMSDTSHFIGSAGSTYDGDTMAISHKPSDYSMGFQLGLAANEKDNDEGIAGWFHYTATLAGTNYTNWGDMNADLSCSVSNCPDDTMSASSMSYHINPAILRSGIERFEKDGTSISFKLFPNPVHEQFFLQASEILEQSISFEICNMLGQQIMAGQIDAGHTKEKIHTHHLAAGVYMLRVLVPGGKDTILRFEKTN